jgi:hypothetical protein
LATRRRVRTAIRDRDRIMPQDGTRRPGVKAYSKLELRSSKWAPPALNSRFRQDGIIADHSGDPPARRGRMEPRARSPPR